MDCIADNHAILGEGPCWSMRDQAVLWTDIYTPQIFRWTEAAGLKVQPVSENICSIVPRESGGYFGAGYNGLMALDDSFALTPVGNPDANHSGNRFNDGKVDRAGRFWAGTMSRGDITQSGSLYRVDSDLSWTTIDTGYLITNGPAFSVDGGTLYHTDSALQTVYAYALDRHGNATDRRIFLQFAAEDGYPDGMTVDAEGCLWIAFWDGWCVRRFSPDGQMLTEIPVPVQRPTSVVFGGAALDQIFVTSASRDLSETDLAGQPQAGGLFTFRPGVSGLAERSFAG